MQAIPVGRIPTPQLVQAQLAKILETKRFRSCGRLRRLLTFLVERALAHDTDVKEYTVALEVFDKPVTFDPRKDSDVRVAARQLRLKVDSYYLCEGANDSVLIRLRPGGYVPSFYLRDSPISSPCQATLSSTVVVADDDQEKAQRVIGWLEQLCLQPSWVRCGSDLLRYANGGNPLVVIKGLLGDGMTTQAVREALPGTASVLAVVPEGSLQEDVALIAQALPDAIMVEPLCSEHVRAQVRLAIARNEMRAVIQPSPEEPAA